MNAKSHSARQLAPIASLAQKSEMRQWRVNCASIARQVGMGVNFMANARRSYKTIRNVFAAVVSIQSYSEDEEEEEEEGEAKN